MHNRIGRHVANPRRRSAALAVVLALACAALLTACTGGSGSSGFDPLAAENAAIDRALDSGDCQMEEGLTICASGGTTAPPTPPPASATPTPTVSSGPIDHPSPTTTRLSVTGTPTPTDTPGGLPTGTPTPTGTAPPDTATPTSTPTWTPIPSQPSVETNISSSDIVLCQPVGAGPSCVFLFTFVPSGVPDTAAYRVAVRTRDPNSDWQILPVVGHSALIEVDPNGPDIQIAVLVFLEDPGFVPDQLELLGDSGADYAFVTPVLTPELLGLRAP